MDEAKVPWTAVAALAVVFHASLSVLVIVGGFMERRVLILPWLILQPLIFLLLLILSFTVIRRPVEIYISVPVNLICLAIVMTYYIHLRSQARDDLLPAKTIINYYYG